MRLIIATQTGMLLDRSDIMLIRLGHPKGVQIFTSDSEAKEEHFYECGLEWRAFDGDSGHLAGQEMLIQKSAEATLAVACIVRSVTSRTSLEIIVDDDQAGAGPSLNKFQRQTDLDLDAVPGARRWWSVFSRRNQSKVKIFSVRDDLPRDFLTIG